MPDLADDGFPCRDCPIRKMFAGRFDIHFSGEDCFYECGQYEKYKANGGKIR